MLMRSMLCSAAIVTCVLLLPSARAQGWSQPHCLGEFQVSWAAEATQTRQGEYALDHRSWTLSTGDWDGDGVPDVLAGSFNLWDIPNPKDQEGSAGLYFMNPGAPCGHFSDHRLGSKTTAGDRFGWSAAFIGNIDGDSSATGNPRDDIAIGAPRWPYDNTLAVWSERGRVHIFLSATTGSFTGDLSDAATSANVVIEGEFVGDRFGYSVDRAGDFVGADGIPDFVVGAPGGPLIPGKGKVYIISGADILALAPGQVVPVVGTALPGTIKVVGDAFDDRFGFCVAYGGDVGDNSSGTPDVVVGAPFAKDSSSEVPQADGYVKVVYGGTGGATSPAIADPQGATDPAKGTLFGKSVSGDVDLDGDGFSEVLVGAPLWDYKDPVSSAYDVVDTGRAYAYSYAGGTLISSMTVEGTNPDEYYGWTVSGMGDLGGTGTDWWAVCARKFGTVATVFDDSDCQSLPDGSVGGRLSGRTSFYSGLNVGPCFTVDGESSRDSVGWSMAKIGNVGGSALPDILLGTPRFGPDSLVPDVREVGRFYLFIH